MREEFGPVGHRFPDLLGQAVELTCPRMMRIRMKIRGEWRMPPPILSSDRRGLPRSSGGISLRVVSYGLPDVSLLIVHAHDLRL